MEKCSLDRKAPWIGPLRRCRTTSSTLATIDNMRPNSEFVTYVRLALLWMAALRCLAVSSSDKETDSMKWLLLFVAVLLGSIAVFVAIPRPALLWVATSVGVFGVDVSPARAPTSAPQRSASDGGDSFETRQRETIQPDVAGHAKVIDGDTIEVRSARIRLFGVDAPESAQSCREGNGRWSCGEQATRALAGRIDGRSVACEERDQDRYGRIVAVCHHDGQVVNAWLVREGWAMAYRRYSTAYVDQEAAARRAKRGIWRGEFVAPWDWRRGDRLKAATRDTPRASAGDARDCNIKGNVSYNSGKRIYHIPGDRDYERTRISTSRGERYFCTEAEARAAGWRRAGR